jgi:hypothetical protein
VRPSCYADVMRRSRTGDRQASEQRSTLGFNRILLSRLGRPEAPRSPTCSLIDCRFPDVRDVLHHVVRPMAPLTLAPSEGDISIRA